MTTLRARLALLLAGSAVGLGLGWGLMQLRHREEPPILTTVDKRGPLDRALAERAAHGPPADQLPPVADPRLRREPLDLETARLFFPPAGLNRPYNTRFYAPNEPNTQRWIPFADHPRGGFTRRTNSLGMLEDHEVLAEHPDLRILVAGDSHGAGLCENAVSFTHRMEARLAEAHPHTSIEALNASAGGYNPYNYLGILEEYLSLEPDVFVMCVFGGNDFAPMMHLQRWFHYRPPPSRQGSWSDDLQRSLRPPNIASQELSQVRYFLTNAEDVDLAIETVDAITMEVERLCREHGIRLLLVYLPPPFVTQARWFAEEMKASLRRTGLSLDDVQVSERIANAWLARAKARGVDLLDLRPMFREAHERLYNHKADCHINLRAHERIGELLAERVEAGWRPAAER